MRTAPPPRHRRWALGAAALLAALGCAGAARADCTTTADCADEHTCQDGQCVAAAAATPASATPVGSGVTSDERARRSAAKFLITAGIGAIGSGYVLAVGGAGIGAITKSNEDSQYGGSCADSAALSFIPLIGPFLTLANYPRHQVVAYGKGTPSVLDCNGARTATTALVVIDEVIQLGGVGMLVAGLIVHATVAQTQTASVELVPGAVGAPLGLTMRVVQF